MNKTELKVFLKGLANFYVVLMIIAFLPTPGKDCSPGRLVRCITIYTIVSIVIFSAVYFWNRIREAVRTYEQRTTIRYQVSEISAFYPDCW